MTRRPTTRPRAVRSVAVLLPALLAVLIALIAAPSASAADATPQPAPSGQPAALTFGIRPSGETGDPRSAFRFRLEPGAEVTDSVSVFNYSTSPLTLKLYVADAVTNDSGDVSLLPRATTSDLASWIAFAGPSKTAMIVPARTRVDVPFTLTVPAKATPGDHIGGVAVVMPAKTVDAQGNTVAVDSVVGVPLSIRVGGEAVARVEIQQLAARYDGSWQPWRSGSITANYRLVNSGNVAQTVEQSLALAGLVGGTRVVGGDRIEALLPGAAIDGEVVVPDVWPLIRYDVTARAVPMAAPGDPLADIATAAVSVWAVPWPQLAGLLLLIALALIAWRLRARRRGAGPSAPSTPLSELVESA